MVVCIVSFSTVNTSQQSEASVLDDTVSAVFSNRTVLSGCGEQPIALAIACDTCVGDEVHGTPLVMM